MRYGRRPKIKRELPALSYYKTDNGPVGRLMAIEHQLGQEGISSYDLPNGQQQIYHDLCEAVENPTCHAAAGQWKFGVTSQETTDCGLREYKKPRMRLNTFFTSAGNLSMTWHPGHIDLNHSTIEAPEWLDVYESFGSFERPSNELLFVHDARSLRSIERHDDLFRVWVNSALLAALNATMNWIVDILKIRFDVQAVGYIRIKEASPKTLGLPERKVSLGGNELIPVGCETANSIDDERERLISVVQSIPENHAVEPEPFWTVASACVDDNGVFNEVKASKRLRKEGYKSLTPAVVRNLHRDFNSAIDCRLWSPPGRVVQLHPFKQGSRPAER